MSSLWGCNWCIQQHLCTHKATCEEGTIIYNERVRLLLSPSPVCSHSLSGSDLFSGKIAAVSHIKQGDGAVGAKRSSPCSDMRLCIPDRYYKFLGKYHQMKQVTILGLCSQCCQSRRTRASWQGGGTHAQCVAVTGGLAFLWRMRTSRPPSERRPVQASVGRGSVAGSSAL